MFAQHRHSHTRRLAILIGCASPFTACVSAASNEASALVARADAANQAFIRGDMHRWYDLAGPISEDFTLMQPFGGETSHGFDGSDEHLAELASRFRNGEATLELEQTYATADMVVLVMVERQHGEVGRLPDQDWSLRVTQVYRRDPNGWALVHRHADPLVAHRNLDRTAALARGE